MRTLASAILGVSLLVAPVAALAQSGAPAQPAQGGQAAKPVQGGAAAKPAQPAPAPQKPAAQPAQAPTRRRPGARCTRRETTRGRQAARDAARTPPAPTAATPAVGGPAVTPPAGYTIGPDDVLGVLFWREKDLSVEQVTVRPDGMITLPLVNDIKAAGLTPEQLRDEVMKAANRFVEDPNATIVVRQINSRRFYVTGQVGKPGTYALLSNTTILQALALAGGLAEYAKGNDIVLMRTENGKTKTFPFRYKDVIKGKNLEQNIELRPGDTLVVP